MYAECCEVLSVASGMAALSAALLLLEAGQHVVAGSAIYGETSRLLAQATVSVDTLDL